MESRVADLLVTGADLAEYGDWYAGRRLPEFRFTIEDGEKTHQLHAIGRYLQCEIHNDKAAAAMRLGVSELACQSLAKAWHESFGQRLMLAKFSNDRTQELDNAELVAAVPLIRCVMATMAARTKELLPELSGAEALLLVNAYMDHEQDWLAGVPKTDLRPLLSMVLAVEQHLALAPALARDSNLGAMLRNEVYGYLITKPSLGIYFLPQTINSWLVRNVASVHTNYYGLGERENREFIMERYRSRLIAVADGQVVGDARALGILRWPLGGALREAGGGKFLPQLAGHELEVTAEGTLVCSRHDNSSCRGTLALINRSLAENPDEVAAVGALLGSLAKLVVATVAIEGQEQKAFWRALVSCPASWGHLEHLRDFIPEQIGLFHWRWALDRVPEYLALEITPERVDFWMGQGLEDGWRMKLAEQLKELRVELRYAEAAQLASAWRPLVYQQLCDQPEAVVAVSRWQDRGYTFAAITEKLVELSGVNETLVLPAAPAPPDLVGELKLVGLNNVEEPMDKLERDVRNCAASPTELQPVELEGLAV